MLMSCRHDADGMLPEIQCPLQLQISSYMYTVSDTTSDKSVLIYVVMSAYIGANQCSENKLATSI